MKIFHPLSLAKLRRPVMSKTSSKLVLHAESVIFRHASTHITSTKTINTFCLFGMVCVIKCTIPAEDRSGSFPELSKNNSFSVQHPFQQPQTLHNNLEPSSTCCNIFLLAEGVKLRHECASITSI